LFEQLARADVLLFDGTFWSDDELKEVFAAGQSAREIGHIPVSGPDGSLELLSGLKARKIYVHLNNTNPLLDPSSTEYRLVREAGWEVGEDGWEFQL
jgi:pyrroloquinoline quinone biosynthesis protein B